MARESYRYDGGLDSLFSLLSRALAEGRLPSGLERPSPSAERRGDRGGGVQELFSATGGAVSADAPDGGTERSGSSGPADRGPFSADRELTEISWMARLDFVYAWMSELPVELEALSFAYGVVMAARAARARGEGLGGARRAAEIARADRGDAAVRATLAAGYKVQREAHRLIGLLRFVQEGSGRSVARCSCDHLTLPALSAHFLARFGSRSWAIVDERRDLALVRDAPEPPLLRAPADAGIAAGGGHADGGDEWESLWKDYHRAVTIESRANPGLQRRLMPARYWKYLPELR